MGNITQELEALVAQFKAIIGLIAQSGRSGLQMGEDEVLGLVMLLEGLWNKLEELISKEVAG